ncbi:DUF5681 domain-containing protein [Acidisoma silvae]|uniref:DUF5681 domain-containing protein n=1 Tax=Acidisoma silvae TaxID=2802396 RepID=A0A963YW74_9PROT|nr:DUF5681 domain-containing protein [Acidisoma silvae]MCB8878269.1 hypothetical protein [Acidisoma silvae]
MTQFTVLTERKQGNLRPFRPGQSGNPRGRPKGSRHKLSEAFVAAVLADFNQHGAAVIEQVRSEDPVAYLRLIASLVPKEFDLGGEVSLRIRAADLSDDELAAIVAAG